MQEPDLDWEMLDSTSVRAHRHTAGQQSSAPAEGLGRSRGSFTSKLHVIVDALGNPLRVVSPLATRYDKTANSFLGMVRFVAALLWLR
ncbi:hypothetical protein [Hymenobacter terrigena]